MQRMRPISEALRLERDHHHPNSIKKTKPLNHLKLHQRMIELLRKRQEPVDEPAGVTGYDLIYRSDSLFSTHANLSTIGGYLVCGDDE